MKRITIEKSLESWDFEVNPVFIGKYVETILIEPEKSDVKPFNQHIFIEAETGDEVYIPDNYLISKSIKKIVNLPGFEKMVIEIVFTGKTEINGRPFSKFTISVIEDENEEIGSEKTETIPELKKRK